MSKNENPQILDLTGLSLIPKLLEKIELLEQEIKVIKNSVVPELDLTKRADIKKYLDVTDSTISRYIDNGTFKRGIHYTKTINGKKVKISFIESAIKSFKENK